MTKGYAASVPTAPQGSPLWLVRAMSDLTLWVQGLFRGPQRLTSYTVLGVPDATVLLGSQIYVNNESGGAVPAFSDGTNWRRVTDRAIVS